MADTLKNLLIGAAIGAAATGGTVATMQPAPLVGKYTVANFQPIRLPSFLAVPGDSLVLTVKKIGAIDTALTAFVGIKDSAVIEAKITPKRM